MLWALGRALLLQPQPSSLEAITYCCSLPMKRDRVSAVGLSCLAQTIAHGQLPSLVILDLTPACFEPDAAVLLWEALASGACPKLRQLGLEAGSIARPDCLQAMAAAFERRMDRQCDELEVFELMDRRLIIGDLVVTEADVRREGLVRVLLSRSFTELRILRVSLHIAADAVGAYLAAAKRPKLRELYISCNPCHPATFQSISGPLTLPAAPNLEKLVLLFLVEAAVDCLAQVFEAGELASLKEIYLIDCDFDGETMAKLMEGVLGSGHRGAALRTLQMKLTNRHDGDLERIEMARAASRALIHGLRDGAFPNLEVLDMNDGTMLLADDDVVMELVAALEQGVPCACTLGMVRLACRPHVKRELRRVLSLAVVE